MRRLSRVVCAFVALVLLAGVCAAEAPVAGNLAKPLIPFTETGEIDWENLCFAFYNTNDVGVVVYPSEDVAVTPVCVLNDANTLVIALKPADESESDNEPEWLEVRVLDDGAAVNGYVRAAKLDRVHPVDTTVFGGLTLLAGALVEFYDTDLLPEGAALPDDLAAAIALVKGERIVYVAKTGKKYHYVRNCSGMKSPRQMTLNAALEKKYTACKKCVKD